MMSYSNELLLKKGDFKSATTAVIMLHGRGATAENILGLSAVFPQKNVCYLAPQADQLQWYPAPFTQPRAKNQPYLDEAMALITSLVNDLSKLEQIKKIYLLGFSQGACLSLTYLMTYPDSISGVMALSGGLIGTSAEISSGVQSLENKKVFMGCSLADPYIPLSRLKETVEILNKLKAEVLTNFYPQPGHSVAESDIEKLVTFLE